MQFEHLFSPIKIGTRTARNRIVFAAHGVSNPFFLDDANPTGYIAYQVARAKGGCGVNIIGSCPCHWTSMSSNTAVPLSPPTPEIFIPKLRQLSDALHDYGSLAFLQLWIYGNQDMSPPGKGNWGFTALPAKEGWHEVCHEMDDTEINEIIDSFVRYTLVAKEGGMDGVEVHACHGDIVQQSWTPWANQRTDKWGEPMAFSTELASRMRAAAGPDFTIGFRITGDDFMAGGLDIEANKKIAGALEATNKIDFLGVSFAYGGFSYAYTVGTMYIPPASISVPLASGIKQVVKSIPVIACSRINEPTLAEKAIAEGHADMVGIVRGQIADPEFGNKAREGRVEDIRLCIACNQGCWEGRGVGVLSCTQNFVAGKESTEYATIKPAPKRKKVLVIGGGPAGMEAARVTALRGHDVTLYEKEKQLGGQINTLIKAPGREEFSQVTRYLTVQLDKLNIKIKQGIEATAELVKKEKPDVVVVAVGSLPHVDNIPGSKQANVCTPSQVLNEEVTIGDRVVIFDNTGLQEAPTVADYLAQRGKKVELVTYYVTLGAYWGVMQVGDHATHLPIIWSRLKQNGVVITPYTNVKSISGKTITIVDIWTGEERKIENIDTLVMATGYRSNTGLYNNLKGQVDELYAVGDCYVPKRVLDAVHNAYATAFHI